MLSKKATQFLARTPAASIAMTALTFTAMLVITSNSQAQTTSYVVNSGSCTSQGAWTQKALDQANSISETVNKLENDENCKGLAAQVKTIGFPTDGDAGEAGQKSARAETLMSELASLRTVLQKSGGAGALLNPILAKSTLESMTGVTANNPNAKEALASLRGRVKAASTRGLDMLNTLFTTLPQYKKCMQNRPDLIAGLFVGGVRMASAFSSGGQGINTKFGETIGNFLQYLQDANFSAIKKALNQQKFWSELSCLIETSQANYCSVQDGFELIKSQKLMSKQKFVNTPLEGYFIVQREVPIVSDWIRKIQLGIEPRLVTDAQFKKVTWDSVVRLFNDINDLPALYFENYNTVYKNLQTAEQKQNNIRELLYRLSSIMGGEAKGTNFFTQAVNSDLLPFFLLGRDQIPAEILATGMSVIPAEKYLLNLDLTPELRNPDDTMNKILVRLREIMDKAMITGAEYFRTRMSVDQVNLVDESITGSAITVRQSLVNIRSYLVKMYKRLRVEGESQVLLPSLVDTISRVDGILRKFALLDVEAKKLDLSLNQRGTGYSLSNMTDYASVMRPGMAKNFENIITSVYLEFNILLQRDSFFNTRMGTYVRHDYFNRVKHEDFSQYTNQLLMTSGNNILDRLQDYQQFNIAEAEQDLSNANVINMSNLNQLEALALPHIENYLMYLNKQTGRIGAAVNNPNPFAIEIPVIFAAKQDRNNEAENIRAKICIQTLGFKAYRRFLFLCAGAELKSTLEAQSARYNLPLRMNYLELYKKRTSQDNIGNMLTNSSLFPSQARFSQVCGLRDYFRNNHVAWLTQNFNAEANFKRPVSKMSAPRSAQKAKAATKAAPQKTWFESVTSSVKGMFN